MRCLLDSNIVRSFQYNKDTVEFFKKSSRYSLTPSAAPDTSQTLRRSIPIRANAVGVGLCQQDRKKSDPSRILHNQDPTIWKNYQNTRSGQTTRRREEEAQTCQKVQMFKLNQMRLNSKFIAYFFHDSKQIKCCLSVVSSIAHC